MPQYVSDETLEADESALLALKDLPDYQAVNAAYSVGSLVVLAEELSRTQEATLRARMVLAAARDAEIAAARLFHDGIRGAKNAVLAQYGSDSPAVQAIGLKRRSEYKRPVRRVARSMADTLS